MPQDTTQKPEPTSMEEVISDLSKPFEFRDNAGEIPPGSEDTTPPAPSKGRGDSSLAEDVKRDEGLKKQAAQSVDDEAKKFESNEIARKISEFGNKEIGIKKLEDKTKKEGEKLEDTTTKPGDQKDQTQQQGPKPRDYTGFTDQEAGLLKRMSNEAFDFVSKELKQYKEDKKQFEENTKKIREENENLKKGVVSIPENYYDNPDAVILTPEFGTAQDNYVSAQNQRQHWQYQLGLIEKGENWTTLTKDPKTGVIGYGQSYESGAEAKAYVMGQLSQAQNLEIRSQANLENVISSFKGKSQEFQTKIREAEKTFMPYFEDEKGDAFKLYQEVAPEVEKFGIKKTNPAFNMLAKSIALNFMFRDAYVEANSRLSKGETIKQDIKKAGPTGDEIHGSAGGSSGGANNGKKVMSFSEMDAHIRRAS